MGRRAPRHRSRTERIDTAALPAPASRGRIALTLGLFAVIFIALEVGSYTQKSAGWDEPIHVSDGYASLAQHDYRVDPEHPPFLRMWAALPLVAMNVTGFGLSDIDREGAANWAWSLYPYCRKFLYGDNDADVLLYRARFMIVLLGVALGVLVFAWAYAWLGYWPAAAALAAYTLEPNIAAHAGLVTTDFGFALFMFGTVYFLWRASRRWSWPNLAGLVACFVLAVVSKFSAVVLIAIVIALLAWMALRVASVGPIRAAVLLAALAVSAYAGIWAVYSFRYAPGASPGWLYDFSGNPYVQQHAPGLLRIVSWIDRHHLLPNVFSQGFLFGQAKADTRHAFLMGSYSDTGWWYYFPVAVLIKTPMAVLGLAAAGLVGGWVARARVGVDALVFVTAPIVIFLGAAMTTHINIGVRHVLPIYPFLILIGAVAARQLLDRPGRVGAIGLSAILAFGALEFFSNYPDQLAFFNLAAGGPSKGGDYLTDSNLDWGQDLKPLKAWMDANQVPHINLAYFGSAFPPYYKINATYLPGGEYFQPGVSIEIPGYVAISATVLSGVYLNDRDRAFYRPFKLMAPVASVGKSIFIYRVDRPWWQ